MILAVDVHYAELGAVAAGVCFEDWPDARPSRVCISRFDAVAPCEPGILSLQRIDASLHHGQPPAFPRCAPIA